MIIIIFGFSLLVSWLVGGLKPIVRMWNLNLRGKCPPWRIFLWDLKGSYLREFRRKITENSKRLGRRAQPGNESGASRLPTLRAEPLNHWWGLGLS